MEQFTHLDAEGHPVMVDVSEKKRTLREATAEGWVLLPESIYRAISRGSVTKGNVLRIAEVAGIMATKRTSDLIPLCHSIRLDSARVRCELKDGRGVYIASTVRAGEVTGVEMEALTGVNVAALTIYDMCKGIDRGMVIDGIRLLEKSGGRSGHYRAEKVEAKANGDVCPISVGILTVSDRCSRGDREDLSGPALAEMMATIGGEVRETAIIPDEEKSIASVVKRWSDELELNLVLVTGGTGLSSRDVTPQVLISLGEREVPGFGEYMRMKTSVYTKRSILSRGIAVTRKRSLLVALPGSERGATECLEVILPVLSHAVETLCDRISNCGGHTRKG